MHTLVRFANDWLVAASEKPQAQQLRGVFAFFPPKKRELEAASYISILGAAAIGGLKVRSTASYTGSLNLFPYAFLWD